MKAILCTRFGGPDDLELADLPDPQPAAGEVAVAVKAAALNFFDTLIIAGKYQMKPAFPFSPARHPPRSLPWPASTAPRRRSIMRRRICATRCGAPPAGRDPT